MIADMFSAAMAALCGYLIPFAIFSGLGLLIAGRNALVWSSSLLASVRTNLLLSLVNPLIAPMIMASVVLVRHGYTALDMPELPGSLWQSTPLWMSILAWVLTIDFCDYWNHRLLHMRGFWDIHAVHHSDAEVNWTTSSRIHVLEAVVMQVSYILLASWINIPPESVGAVMALRLLHNNWVHTRYDFHLGPLTKVIATPRFHHWHHADDPAAYNSNFGNTFAFWDVIFGTYRVPSAYRGKFGFDGSPGNNVTLLLIWPYLRWITVFYGMEQKKNKPLTL